MLRVRQGVRTGLGHEGITCVLETQFSSFFFCLVLLYSSYMEEIKIIIIIIIMLLLVCSVGVIVLVGLIYCL